MSGYVYLIGNSVFRWYKIGKSKNPEVRIDQLGILLPFKIRIMGIWKAHDHTLLEATAKRAASYQLHNKNKIRF